MKGSNQESEDYYFHDGDIVVTKTRFAVGSRTFVLAGITSVRCVEIDPSRVGPIIAAAVGLILGAMMIPENASPPSVIADIAPPVMMIAGLGTAAVWWIRQKPDFAVVCATASGEVMALRAQDEIYVLRVVQALTQAIIARG